MSDDPRCCGTGTCIIDGDGRCWCGQVWDGEKMCFGPPPELIAVVEPARSLAGTSEPTPTLTECAPSGRTQPR